MRFEAPWGAMVKLITIAVSALLLIIAVAMHRQFPPESDALLWFGAAVGPLLLLVGSALFTVRGYRLEPGRLLVDRLLWPTAIDLAELRSARHDPAAMARSLRLFGNGGLFAITGLFRNEALGNYRAFATDPKRAVVLELEERKIVVTPDRPEEFVRRLGELRAEPPAGERAPAIEP